MIALAQKPCPESERQPDELAYLTTEGVLCRLCYEKLQNRKLRDIQSNHRPNPEPVIL